MEYKQKILVVNGPNLNLLGSREPEKYGHITLEEIEALLVQEGGKRGVEVLCFQSNYEGALINFIHREGPSSQGMLFNPGAFTHTSVALRDAVLAVAIPFIEVHITNVYRREAFRQISYFKDISIGQIVGLGSRGYVLGLTALLEMIEKGEIKKG